MTQVDLFRFVFGMANPAQHGNNIKWMDKVDKGRPADNANDKNLLGNDGENEEQGLLCSIFVAT